MIQSCRTQMFCCTCMARQTAKRHAPPVNHRYVMYHKVNDQPSGPWGVLLLFFHRSLTNKHLPKKRPRQQRSLLIDTLFANDFQQRLLVSSLKVKSILLPPTRSIFARDISNQHQQQHHKGQCQPLPRRRIAIGTLLPVAAKWQS